MQKSEDLIKIHLIETVFDDALLRNLLTLMDYHRTLILELSSLVESDDPGWCEDCLVERKFTQEILKCIAF